MSQFLDSIVERAKADKKTIVLPEGNDPRTLEAAERILAEDIADLIILGNAQEISECGYDLSKAEIVDVETFPDKEEYARELYELRKAKGLTPDKALAMMDDVMYLGVMMVKLKHAHGMVAGACTATADVLRPSLQILKTAPGAKLVSSFFIMCVPDCEYGANGTFLYADCGLEIQPDAEHLADIAVNAAGSFRLLVGEEPVVAMLSHSTYGSANNEYAAKVVEATRIAKELAPDLALDGEMQADAAIIPEIGAIKAPGSPVAGHANVLVFPDLDAGSVAYKLTERLAKAEAYGPITQCIAAPVNDLSRGCSAHDIYGVIAITCVQAQGKETHAAKPQF